MKHGPQPKTQDGKRMRRYSFFLYEKDVQRLESLAKRIGINRSAVLRDVLHSLDHPRILVRYLTITDENLNRR